MLEIYINSDVANVLAFICYLIHILNPIHIYYVLDTIKIFFGSNY